MVNRLIIKDCPSYSVQIFIAGDYETARQICEDYCSEVGLCVTVTKTNYAYRGGNEDGVIVGLINYPRFPKEIDYIFDTALELAWDLKLQLNQGSFTIQDYRKAEFYSDRDEDQ